ncbi:hypothetical protein F5X68DRAFT_196227 [Plectosphaerella plurivora]|uniref:Uncharacterized protein n=1 Tax=Plectosphaerella plurivora TaxID=936078 RepID=A0A9P8VLY1_9PEZI|nr:hypothetical protein F5X68DRAFT_196227 [Plectosphaerella plurivora]
MPPTLSMFELPEAKRVRREDLRDSSPESDSADEDERRALLEAKLRESFAKTFATDNLDVQPVAKPAVPPTAAPAPKHASKQDSDDEDTEMDEEDTKIAAPMPQEPEEEEFEFRLFKSAAPPAKIVLVEENDDAPAPEGEMLRARPLSYYVAEPLTAEERDNIEFAALSGEEVLRRSTQRWWGMEMPWKVTHVGAGGKILRDATSRETLALQVERLTGAEGEGEDGKVKRKRMGKKRRIAMRTKDRAAKKKAEAEDKSKMSKEEHLKEKKKRLNRLRKLKRRAKAQEGKGDGTGAGEGDAGSGSNDDSE